MRFEAYYNKHSIKRKVMNDKKKKKVRLYLTVDKKFYDQLIEKAKSDYMKVATWTTRFLMKELSEHNKPDCLTSNPNEQM